MTESIEPSSSSSPWWGSYDIEEGTGGRWDVGPSTFWLYRTEREWRIVHRPSADPVTTDPMANRSDVTLPVPDEDMAAILETTDDRFEITRYSFERTESQIDVRPALADRPIVSRPEHPLHVPSGETVTLYLSTPLWMCIHLSESDRLLQEMPSHRMSDTWFGTSTREGELCYATRTTGRLQLESLPRRLHRAVTPLHIENAGEDSLLLERVQLPVRHLALYRTSRDLLWTQTVEMTRTEGSEGADIRIRRGSPKEVDEADKIQDPRDPEKRGLFTSTFGAFGALFGS
jgi:hypothetical protein